MTKSVVYLYPTLYSFSSKDKIKEWTIGVVEEDGLYYLGSGHGYKGQTITNTFSSAIKGKNIGKKNETSPLGQAMAEALSKWQKKIDENYTEVIPTSKSDFVNVLPMLAHKWQDRSHNIVFPAVVQPKLNGVRCLATKSEDGSEFIFSSRGGKNFTTLKHISNELITKLAPCDYPLDGEIFIPGVSFETIIRAVKKQRDISAKLEFWVFDIAAPDLEYHQRLSILHAWAKSMEEHPSIIIKVVPSYPVNNVEEIMAYHKIFSIENEGTMVRNLKGKYLFDYRSVDLLKFKDFIDQEFLIIGGSEGHGADEGTIVFQCITGSGKTFSVRPRGSREQRREWFKDLPNIIGKFGLTTRFQNLSEDGVPIFPVGLAIRDYE